MAQIQKRDSKVLVTGVSGYIGAHVAQQLLLHGYDVRGSVRSIANQAKIDKLHQQITEGLPVEGLPSLEFVEADLLKEDSWPAAVAGCQFVCHVASPFPLDIPRNPDDIIKPAVDGTIAVMKAAAADAGVKRVSLTSSLAAIRDVKIDDKSNPEKIYNEDDWVDPDKVEPYSQSKILAEKAAMKFIEDLPSEEGKHKLELVVINPCFVLGPLLADNISSSVIGIKRLINRSTPALPKFHIPICDVRDVALAHVKSLEGPEHVSKRYLIFSDSRWIKDVAHIIHKEFKPLGYFVPTLTVPNTFVWLASFFDKTTAMVVPRLDKEFRLDNKRMVEELKVTPTDIERTLLDTCYSLIEKGHVRSTRKYKKSKQPQPKVGTDEQTTQAPVEVGGDQA